MQWRRVTELGSDSFRRTIVPSLAVMIVLLGFIAIGFVTGYYFAGKRGTL